MKRHKKACTITLQDKIKAMRKGNREQEMELLGPGFHSHHDVHKSAVSYTRKLKHKGRPLWMLLLLLAFALTAGARGKQEPLRVSVLGDSYSTFEGYLTPDTNFIWYFRGHAERAGNDVKTVEQTWWHQVITQKGWKLERNNSFSGSTICNTGYHREDYSRRSFIARMPYLGEPDVILVCGGTNDSWAGSPIGDYKYGRWTDDDLWSFRPAMAMLCSELQRQYPKAHILFILNCELKPEINESVETICRHYGMGLLKLHDVHKQDGHPSQAGMTTFAQQVIAWMKANWKL